ncbi:MAG: hypothetical protein KGL04_07145 [Elusimicrobia bacterium]|nr:hypothetical protein [Elusimicrobiota bacterium]
MTRTALGKIAAAFFAGCLFLLTIHDLAHAKEKHSAPCQVCVMVARTAAHTAKAAPHVIARAARISDAPLPAIKLVCRAPSRAASRDPPAA